MKKLLLLAALVGCQDAAYNDSVEPYAADQAVTAEPAMMADAIAEAEPPTEYARADVAQDGPPRSGAEAPQPQAPSRPSADRSDRAETVPAALAGRQLRRSADLRVSVESFDETLREARSVARRYGGLVTGEDGDLTGDLARTTLTLRVPSDRFETAVDALAGLGTVEQRSVSVDDVTAAVVDLDARLRAKRAAEARIVAMVAEANGFEQMLTLQGRLDGLRGEIESMEASARALRGSVALSTIRATFVPVGAVPPPPPGVFAEVGHAVAAGWYGLLAVVLGVLPLWPLAVLGAMGFAAWRRVQPRLTA